MMNRAMVTGATGFLGSRVMDALRGDMQAQAFEKGLLRGADEDTLVRAMAEFSPDFVIHTAAISDTGYCQQHPQEAEFANVEMSLRLARACKKIGAKLIFCSSDQIYNGSEGAGPFSEDAPVQPWNVYGLQKLRAERELREISPDTVCLRLTWMYDFPQYGVNTHGNFLMQLLSAAIEGKRLTYSTNNFRGLTYARQVAAQLARAGTLAGGVYNFGSENPLNMVDTARAFLNSLGYGEQADKIIQADMDKPLYSLAISCAKIRANGIDFDTTAQGIQRCLRDYQFVSIS